MLRDGTLPITMMYSRPLYQLSFMHRLTYIYINIKSRHFINNLFAYKIIVHFCHGITVFILPILYVVSLCVIYFDLA